MPPPGIVRHDGDDPYLVVAADKGTATFSDIANEISAAHGFWLGDAFASGGSAGYDHKRMGITARGAWEAVQAPLPRARDATSRRTDFTVVGIGDMSGDVFGNGMLLSPHIRLIGAFNHAHVFLDPDPDPAASHAERARLFALARSSWSDYDPALISPGGGVYPRTAKSIELSPQVRAALDVDGRAPDPRRADPRAAARARRPALERRHRHLRQGDDGDAAPTSATAPTTASASTARSCAAASSARAATSASPSAGASSTRSPAAASTPTRSTTSAASTARTTRSTSRSCSTPSSPPAT